MAAGAARHAAALAGAGRLAAFALNSASHPRDGEIWVTAFDVGQGMAVLIETPHRRLLYDTGPAYSPETDGGNRVILPYLHARGIDKLDGVIVSHNDNDHSGGALSIFEEMPIDWVASSLDFDSRIVRAAPAHRRCVAGQNWEWDGVRFEMLQPEASSYASTKYKPNAHSCTVKVSVGKGGGNASILLAGDIEAVQEAERSTRYRRNCRPPYCWRHTTAAAPGRRCRSCKRSSRRLRFSRLATATASAIRSRKCMRATAIWALRACAATKPGPSSCKWATCYRSAHIAWRSHGIGMGGNFCCGMKSSPQPDFHP